LCQKQYAGVAELADALDLGSSGNPVQVQVLSPVPYRVFITDLSIRVSTRFLFVSKLAFFVCKEQVSMPALLFYAGTAFGIYSTATPWRVSVV
jgi:hypothetical protein